MSLTGDQELIIRKIIAERIAEAGMPFVVPSPVYFSNKADFWATVAPKLTKKEIETTALQHCTISYLRFEDDPAEGCEDEPLISIFYRLHVFREYEFERADESDAPDLFLKKVLRSEREFMNALFAVRQAFLGVQPLVGLPEGWSGETNSLTQEDFAEEREQGEYVGGVEGFSADLVLKVEVIIQE